MFISLIKIPAVLYNVDNPDFSMVVGPQILQYSWQCYFRLFNLLESVKLRIEFIIDFIFHIHFK